MASSEFNKTNGIYECKLLLEDKSKYIIPMREDGYINGTSLCSAVNKKIADWKRLKETKNIVTILQDKYGKSHIELLKVNRGGFNKYQGTWVHPDLGINLAQWCSPNFSIQVSRWIRELIITKKVEIGKEKDMDKEFDKLKEELNKTKEELDKEKKDKEEIKENLSKTKEELTKVKENLENNEMEYENLDKKHEKLKNRKESYKFEKGPCVYIAKNNINDNNIYKIGYTNNPTDRNMSLLTANVKIIYICYTLEAKKIESYIKDYYRDNIEFNNNTEWIYNITKDEIIKEIREYCDKLKYNYNEITDIEKRYGYLINKTNKTNNDNILTNTKKCKGPCDLVKNINEFGKYSFSADGLYYYCKECRSILETKYKENKQNKEEKENKENNSENSKICTGECGKKLPLDKFGYKNGGKNNLNSMCKECFDKHQKEYKKKEKELKKDIYFKCPYCKIIINRRDSLKRHINKKHEEKKHIKLFYKALELHKNDINKEQEDKEDNDEDIDEENNNSDNQNQETTN